MQLGRLVVLRSKCQVEQSQNIKYCVRLDFGRGLRFLTVAFGVPAFMISQLVGSWTHRSATLTNGSHPALVWVAALLRRCYRYWGIDRQSTPRWGSGHANLFIYRPWSVRP